MSNVSEILKLAAEKLEDSDKWIQGQMFDLEGRMCMVGAIREVLDEERMLDKNSVYHSGWFLRVQDVIADVLISEGLPTCIEDFNDEPSTTHEDVMLVLKKAIAKAEQK